MRKKSIRFSLTETRITFVGDVLDGADVGAQRSAADVEAVVEALVAPLYFRALVTGRSIDDALIEKSLMQVRKGLEAGRNLSEPLKETNVFPGMVTQMIGVGEQTGAMDAMLQKIADFYEDEVDAAVKDLLAALEPAMIVVLGVVVGGIVISMYLPLFSLIGQLSSAH